MSFTPQRLNRLYDENLGYSTPVSSVPTQWVLPHDEVLAFLEFLRAIGIRRIGAVAGHRTIGKQPAIHTHAFGTPCHDITGNCY